MKKWLFILVFLPLLVGWNTGWQKNGSGILLNTTEFDGNLSSSDKNVQTAMETIDEIEVQFDGAGVAAPEFLSTGDIKFTVNGDEVTADINDDAVTSAHISDADYGDISASSGVLSLDNTVVDTAELVDDAVTSVKIADNAVALSTQTTGNYVATIADAGNSTITVTGSGSEGSTVTVDAVDLNCTDCIGETEITDDYLLNDGDTGTGVYDFGGATSVEIPNGANPTTDADGEIAYDSDDEAIEVYDGSASRLIGTVQKFSATVYDPDTIQGTEDALPLLPVESDWAPHGIKLLSVGIKTDQSSSYSITFEEWTSPSDATPATIETVSTSTSYEEEDDGTLTDSDIAY